MSKGLRGSWLLRSKAETQHGGGEKGAQAIDEAVAAGIYRERFTETKDPKTGQDQVSQIQVIEQEGTKMHDVSYRDKARAGGKINEDIFKDKAIGMFVDHDNEDPTGPTIMKRPAAIYKAESDDSKTVHSIKKKPATPAAGLTQEQLEATSKEEAAHNDRVNSCIVSALKQSRDLHFKIASIKHVLESAGVEGAKRKVRDIHVESCTEGRADIENNIGALQSFAVTDLDIKHCDAKVDALTQASNAIETGRQAITQSTGPYEVLGREP